MLRVAVVGCGRMGKIEARAASELGAAIVAVCDTNPERAEALALQYPGCTALTSTGRLDLSYLDAIFICTPPAARGHFEVEALTRGVPLLIEKPVSTSAEQVRTFADAARAKGTITAAGYMNRYRRSVSDAQAVASGLRPVGVSAHWVGSIYKVPWWARDEDSGGQLNEQGTHMIDLARLFLGEVESVFAMRQSESGCTDARASIVLRFRSGALGSLFYSCMADVKQIGFTILTQLGDVTLDGWDLELRRNDLVQSRVADAAESNGDIFSTQVKSFFDAIATGDRRLVRADLEEAFRTQLVVDAVRESMTEGRPVTVPGAEVMQC